MNTDIQSIITQMTLEEKAALCTGASAWTTTPVEVGSGSWHWSAPYQDPDARAPYTVDDVIGEIMSDTGARTVVMDAIPRSEAAGFLGMILQNYRDLPLRQTLGMIPNSGDLLTGLIDALAKLL